MAHSQKNHKNTEHGENGNQKISQHHKTIAKKRYMEELMPEDDRESRKRQQLQVDIYGEHVHSTSISANNHHPPIDMLSPSPSYYKTLKPHRPSEPFFGKAGRSALNLNSGSTLRGASSQSPLKKNTKNHSDSSSESEPETNIEARNDFAKEPTYEAPLEAHIKYHLETHWGIPWIWIRRSFLTFTYLFAFVMLLNIFQFLASLSGGVDVPVPLIHFAALREALLDSDVGLPALTNIYNALSFLLPLLSFVFLGFIGTHLPHQVMMPIYLRYKTLGSGLQPRQKCIAGRPVDYLESGRGGASGYDGKPTILLVHDAFGCAHDWHEFVVALGGEFHVLALNLPGHGSCGGSSEELEVENLGLFLSRFKADVIGVTRVHHVVGMGFGAVAALKYASLDSVVDYVASVTMLSPFAIEPVSEQFQDMFDDEELFVSRMTDPVVCRKTLQKLTAIPAFKPHFYFMAKSAQWRANLSCREAMVRVLHKTHSEGALYSSIEQEGNGLALQLLFGDQDVVAKNLGRAEEVDTLKVANCNLHFESFQNIGHDMLNESKNSVEIVSRAVSAFVTKQHLKFTAHSQPH